MDMELMLNQLIIDEDLLKQWISIFSEEIPCALLAIKRAVENNDKESLLRTAHSLKGSLRSMRPNTKDAYDLLPLIEERFEEIFSFFKSCR